jgi:uncharacterized membrane protein (DUF4010 family)
MSAIPIPDPSWRSVAEALLIGLLVGAQREVAQPRQNRGLRDFVLVALTGALCALVGHPWLALVTLPCLVAVFVLIQPRETEERGITTELAAIATFCLSYFAALPGIRNSDTLAIGLTVVVVLFLEAKRSLRKFFRETITETEFAATLRFLALIFVIYPILPEGRFGPHQAIAPRLIWKFVILVSSISYLGYFLRKFLGAERGLLLAGVLGGLASTTAATAGFARDARGDPARLREYWRAATLANAIQFPRLLAIVWVAAPGLALGALPALLAMTAAGLLLSLSLRPAAAQREVPTSMEIRNPFELTPALQFGAVFALVLMASRWAASTAHGFTVIATSFLGGLVDVDSVSVSLGELLRDGKLDPRFAVGGLLLAVFANALFKTGLAFTSGNAAFGGRVAVSFGVMLSAGAACLLFV